MSPSVRIWPEERQETECVWKNKITILSKCLEMTRAVFLFEHQTFYMASFCNSSSPSEKCNWIIFASQKNITASSGPWAFSHPATTCDSGTLAKYIFSKLLLPSVTLTGEGTLRRDGSRRRQEKKVWNGDMREFMQWDSRTPWLSLCPSSHLSVCLRFVFTCTPLAFRHPPITRWDFPWINIINTTPFSHYQSWPTF